MYSLFLLCASAVLVLLCVCKNIIIFANGRHHQQEKVKCDLSSFNADIYHVVEVYLTRKDFDAFLHTSQQVHDEYIGHRCYSLNKKYCDANSSKKLELIKERCRNEVNLLQQIITEINGLKKPLDRKAQSEAKEVDDPDVWPPPTPNPDLRYIRFGLCVTEELHGHILSIALAFGRIHLSPSPFLDVVSN